MPKLLLIDAVYINSHVPARISDAEAGAIRRTLRGSRFMAALRQAVRGVFGRYPTLRRARVTLTR